MTSTTPNTAWKDGRLDARRGRRKLLFGCMHEDVEIERSVFARGSRIFCIASAGSTAMALSAEHEVVAVDINPVQIAYVERRLAGGAVERGSAERFLAFARRFAPLAGWTKERLHEFLALEQPDEQIAYWRAHLDTHFFRAGFDLLFSATTLRVFYARSLIDSLPANVGAVMRQRMERCFGRHPNRRNPYARMLLLGEPVPDPSTVCAERIRTATADAADFLDRQGVGSFNAFSLSNILDGANAAYAERLFRAVRHAAASDALVVLRSFREPASDLGDNRAADDRSMLWGTVSVWTAADLSKFGVAHLLSSMISHPLSPGVTEK
jgi:S-adenosylmethionine:diacylglycerol 3-amino-3-carboxypropyl transferase